MQIVRYLNGKQLAGAMPTVTLKDEGVSSMIYNSWNNIPLREASKPDIIYSEGGGSGKDNK